MRGRLAAIAFAALVPLAADAAPAPPTPAQLREAEQSRAGQMAAQEAARVRADAARAQERTLGQQQDAALASLRETEGATQAVSERIRNLADRQREAAARLAARSADMLPLLPLVQRLRLFPAETLLAVPQPPEQAVRGVLVLRGIARQLERDAASIRAEQAGLTQLQAQIDVELPALSAAQAAQRGAASALDAQLRQVRQDRRAAEDDAAAAARRAAEDAGRAENLRAAIARIEDNRRVAEAEAAREARAATLKRRDAEAGAARERQVAIARPAGPGLEEGASTSATSASASGAPAAAPVSGTMVRGFGDATEAGPSSGVSYQVAPGARVVSPCGGRMVFSGPFRSFGLLLIVDCGGGYHFVLSGFDRLDAQVGQSVKAGTPVGVMPGWDPRASASRPVLYMELRRNGQAVNPGPFLRAKSERPG
jgi:septal ring factor EnvC (AmiA/AmiB activator)